MKKGAGGKGGRIVVRRRKEGFGRRPGSLGCLWSRHAACAVFSARLTMPACYPLGDAERGVNVADVEGWTEEEEKEEEVVEPVSRA